MKITDYQVFADIKRDYKFVFISDLHGCDNEPILNAINELTPEAVLVGGDFIHNINNYQNGLDFLAAVTSRYPAFCCLGNHEFRFDEDMLPKIKETGVKVLDDEAVTYNELNIGGLTSAVKRGANKDKKANKRIPNIVFLKEFSSKNGFKLLLCHHPEYYSKYIKNFNVDLTLSGHAHGGQWRIFGRGIYAPGQGIFPKHTSGFIDDRLIVGRGLGNPHIIPRINNKPEIINLLITKKP